MGLHNLYIINRDGDEVRSLIRDMMDKACMQGVSFVWLKETADVERLLGDETGNRLIIGVGAIRMYISSLQGPFLKSYIILSDSVGTAINSR